MTTLGVTLVHLALLLGWSHWQFAQPVGELGTVMATRSITVAAPSPAAEPAAPEPAAPEPAAPEPPAPVEPAPTFEAPDAAPAPRPSPRPRPRPRPKTTPTSGKTSPEAPSSPTARDGQSSRDGSNIDARPDFIAGPANFYATVEQPTSRLEDVLIESVMAEGSLPAVVLPRSVEIRYVTSGARGGTPYSGVPATLRWSQNKLHYNLRWEFLSTMAGDLLHNNHGVLTPQGLAPATLRKLDGPHRDERRFDYANRQIVGAVDQPRLDFTPGAQDELSVVVQLAAVTAAQPMELTPGAQLRLPVLEHGSIREATFTVVGEDTIVALGNKSLKTVHMVHQEASGPHSTIEVWLAPSLDYMPARWRVTYTNGDTQDRLAQQAIGLQAMPERSEER